MTDTSDTSPSGPGLSGPSSADPTPADASTSTGTGSAATFDLHQYPEKLVVVRLAAGADIPEWAESSSIFSITATATETSLICAGRSVPTKVPGARGLTGFSTSAGESGNAGVLLALLEPLAAEGISVHTLTTFEMVWVLLSATDVDRAAEAWRRRGHTVAPAVPA